MGNQTVPRWRYWIFEVEVFRNGQGRFLVGPEKRPAGWTGGRLEYDCRYHGLTAQMYFIPLSSNSNSLQRNTMRRFLLDPACLQVAHQI